MSKVGRIGALLAATAMAGMTSAAMAAPAMAAPHGPQGPQPVTNWVQSVRANVPTWVKVYYKTDMNICNVKVTVDGGRSVGIDYPGNRTRFTSFSKDDSLRRGRTDYASVEVDAHSLRPGIALLRSTISYDTCGRHDRTMRKTTVLSLPVTRGVTPGNNQPGNNNNGHDQGSNNGHDQGHNDGHDNDGHTPPHHTA
jgi:hypothetical protein